jgi:hypothetical protein
MNYSDVEKLEVAQDYLTNATAHGFYQYYEAKAIITANSKGLSITHLTLNY